MIYVRTILLVLFGFCLNFAGAQSVRGPTGGSGINCTAPDAGVNAVNKQLFDNACAAISSNWFSKKLCENNNPHPSLEDYYTKCLGCALTIGGSCDKNTGDPRLITRDGLRYDFQAQGDYVLVVTDGLEIQARYRKSRANVSVLAGVALKITDTVIVVEESGNPSSVIINGNQANLKSGDWYEIGSPDSYIQRAGDMIFVHVENVLTLTLKGRILTLKLNEKYANKTRGLHGDGDGNPANDLRTAAGDPVDASDPSSLYGQFMLDWRREGEQSLFVTPFLYIGDPNSIAQNVVRLSDIDPALRKRATIRCLAAGVAAGASLDGCVYDLAITGDDSFIEDALSSAEMLQNSISAIALTTQDVSVFSIESKTTVFLGSPSEGAGEIERASNLDRYTLTVAEGEKPMLVVSRPCDQNVSLAALVRQNGKIVDAYPLQCDSPIALPQGNIEVDVYSPAGDLSEYEFETIGRIIKAATANVEFKTESLSGNTLSIHWQGPNDRRDYITVADKDMTGRQYHNFTYTSEGSPLELRMPDQAGEYEVRYIQGQSNNVLARGDVIVQAVGASLEFDNTIKAGRELTINWTGPNNRKDYIAVADKAMTGRQYHSYTDTSEGSPLELRMPDQTGEYEVRYIQGQSNNILAKRNVIVQVVSAGLEFESTIKAGGELTVNWTGPNNRRDYLAVADKAMTGRQYHSYIYTSEGSSLELRMPDQAGEYEVRYIQGQSNSILAKRKVIVQAVGANLEFDNTVKFGSELAVNWTGPNNRRDYITVADKDMTGRQYHSYTYTSEGSSLELRMPDQPGEYEVRYIQGQSHNILARYLITIENNDN